MEGGNRERAQLCCCVLVKDFKDNFNWSPVGGRHWWSTCMRLLNPYVISVYRKERRSRVSFSKLLKLQSKGTVFSIFNQPSMPKIFSPPHPTEFQSVFTPRARQCRLWVSVCRGQVNSTSRFRIKYREFEMIRCLCVKYFRFWFGIGINYDPRSNFKVIDTVVIPTDYCMFDANYPKIRCTIELEWTACILEERKNLLLGPTYSTLSLNPQFWHNIWSPMSPCPDKHLFKADVEGSFRTGTGTERAILHVPTLKNCQLRKTIKSVEGKA